jgi:phospholipid transport system substrate-binding protein
MLVYKIHLLYKADSGRPADIWPVSFIAINHRIYTEAYMNDKVIALLLILLTSVSASAFAAPYSYYSPYTPYGGPYGGEYRHPEPQAEAGTPAAILKEGVTKLTAFIRGGGAQNRAQAMAYLEQEIAPYFDFAYMTRWAAGPAWREMNNAQRQEMQETITTSFLTTLAQKLTTYSNQSIRYFTPRGHRKDETTVSAWIMQPTGYPIKLDFRFYKSSNGWKIFDVKADGNSAVIYYRDQFRNMYRYSGTRAPHYYN